MDELDRYFVITRRLKTSVEIEFWSRRKRAWLKVSDYTRREVEYHGAYPTWAGCHNAAMRMDMKAKGYVRTWGVEPQVILPSQYKGGADVAA